jgi:hypothetical protein
MMIVRRWGGQRCIERRERYCKIVMHNNNIDLVHFVVDSEDLQRGFKCSVRCQNFGALWRKTSVRSIFNFTSCNLYKLSNFFNHPIPTRPLNFTLDVHSAR